MIRSTSAYLFLLLGTFFQLNAQTAVSEAKSFCHPEENSLIWQQTSAEYKALCIQAYHLAQSNVDQRVAELSSIESAKPLAIVMDLDETVLDNSPYSVEMMRRGESYSSDSWEEWVNLEQAELVPGAKDFIQYAQEKGIEVFFISNRSKNSLAATYSNLIKLGIECKVNELLLKDDNSKLERRQTLDDHTVIMLIGDNLADFHEDFETELSLEERDQLVMDTHQAEFGEKYIILPNNLYGDWMTAIKRAAKGRAAQLELLKGF